MKLLLPALSLISVTACATQTLTVQDQVIQEPVRAEEKAQAQSPVLPTKNVTLVLGDSHMVGGYGDALFAHLKSKSDLLMIANCGAGLRAFTATPVKRPCRASKRYPTVVVRRAPKSFVSHLADPMASLALTAREINPNIVVVGLGTNYHDVSSASIKKLTEILTQNAPAMTKLIWVGPPYFLKKNGDSIPVVNSIRNAFNISESSRGQYVTDSRTIEVVFADSTPFNKARRPLDIPKGDFHFYGKLTKGWADYTWAMIGDEFQ